MLKVSGLKEYFICLCLELQSAGYNETIIQPLVDFNIVLKFFTNNPLITSTLERVPPPCCAGPITDKANTSLAQ